MSGPAYHGRTHLPGGTDPIPGLNIGSPAGGIYGDVVLAEPTLWALWPFQELSGDAIDAKGSRDLDAHIGPDGPEGTITYGGDSLIPDMPDSTSIRVTGIVGFYGQDRGARFVDPLTAPVWLGDGSHWTVEFFWRNEAFSYNNMVLFELGGGLRLWQRGTSSPDPDNEKLWLESSGSASGYSSTVFDAFTTAHIAIRYDGNVVELYIAGSLEASRLDSSFSINHISFGGSETIAGGYAPAYGSFSYGAIYQGALSPATIAEHAGLAGVPSDYAAGHVWTADGLGGADWEPPTIEVTY